MSLWTPHGEHPVDDDRPSPRSPTGPPGGDTEEIDLDRLDVENLTDEQKEQLAALAEEMAETRRRLAMVPAAQVVANHAIGLFELAAIHLQSQPPNLDQATVAIDALAAIVDKLGPRLEAHEAPLRDALAQIRLAFVQVRGAAEATGGQPADD
jgi:Domain of unknown function (DUF1844)